MIKSEDKMVLKNDVDMKKKWKENFDKLLIN